MFYTYLWLREDGTPYYVGKGSGKRAYTNVGHTVYRPEDRARIQVQFWESEEKAFEMEKWWIVLYGRKYLGTGILRNMTNGGDGSSGWVPSEDTKAKIKEARKHQVCTEETKAKMRSSRLGYRHSEETRSKIRESNKTTKQGLWKHGTINGYRRHKCRCAPCKKASHEFYIKNKQEKNLCP